MKSRNSLSSLSLAETSSHSSKKEKFASALKCCASVCMWLMVSDDSAPSLNVRDRPRQASAKLCGFTCACRRARKSLETRWEVRMVRTDGLSFGFILNICLIKNWSSYGRWPGRGGYAPRHIFKIRLFQLGAWNWTRDLKKQTNKQTRDSLTLGQCLQPARGWRENIPDDAGRRARREHSQGTTHHCRTQRAGPAYSFTYAESWKSSFCLVKTLV